MKRAVIALVILALASSVVAQVPCGPLMPNPKVFLISKQIDGSFTRYWFSVANRANFPNVLFVASPNLPPCGLNTNASRTWLHIFNGNGTRIYGYCALSANSQMAKLSFAVPTASPQPKSFFITLHDRRCNRTVKSNVVALP